jgi:hypothetical protein
LRAIAAIEFASRSASAVGSKSPRLKQLRSTSPCRLGFAFLATGENSAGAAVEREALSLLARHRTEGEWCGCSNELAVAAVNWAAAKKGIGLGAIIDPGIADQILAAASPRSTQRPFWVIALIVVALIALMIVLGA